MKPITSALLAFAALSSVSAAEAPKCEIRNVRISSPRLIVSRARSTSSAFATGQFSVEMSFSKPTVKKPVVRLTALCETDGALALYNTFLDQPQTTKGIKRADIMRAYKDSGTEIPSDEREAAYSDPARFTRYLPEVTKIAYSRSIYGSAEMNKGFFRLGKSKNPPRILVWRIEIWQNGVMAESWESSSNGLGKYDLPKDWHAWKKHPGRFRYVAAH